MPMVRRNRGSQDSSEMAKKKKSKTSDNYVNVELSEKVGTVLTKLKDSRYLCQVKDGT